MREDYLAKSSRRLLGYCPLEGLARLFDGILRVLGTTRHEVIGYHSVHMVGQYPC